jgi:hypothetical protein
MRSLLPFLWLALVYFGQSLQVILPIFSDDFASGGLSATIFLYALFTAHLVLVIKNIKILYPLYVLPAILFTQWLILTLIFTNSEAFIDTYLGGDPGSFEVLYDMGYGAVTRTFIIQGLLSLMTSVGLWMERKYDTFNIRKAAYDQDEIERIYNFREKFLPEFTPKFYRFRPLFLKGLTLLGVRKQKVFGFMHTLWLEDTIVIRDIVIDPEQTEDPHMVRSLILKMIYRPEIVNSNAKEVILLIPLNNPEIAEEARSLGFKDHIWPDPSLKEGFALYTMSGVDDPWDPFAHIKAAMRLSLERT